MRWCSALLVLALAALPVSAQVAAVDGPTEVAVPTEQASLFDLAPINTDPTLRVEVDYLYWFLRKMTAPPLLTTGTPNSSGAIGVVGNPGTTILYGNGPLDPRFNRTIGIQLRGTLWLDDEQTVGIHASAFLMEASSSNFTVPHGTLPLARPFINAATGGQDAYLFGGTLPGYGPGLGGFNAYGRTALSGEDINALMALTDMPDFHLGFLVGCRMVQLAEQLRVTATTQVGPNLDGVLGQSDDIKTSNNFFGLQIGFMGEVQLLERLSLSAKATFALGDNHSQIKNSGDTIIDTPLTGRVVLPEGLYVQPSNTGSFDRNYFNTVTEATVTLNYFVTRSIVLRAGYSFLSWTSPIRPTQQITAVNLTQTSPAGLTGPDYPIAPFLHTWFWAQGGQIGLEFRW